MEVKVKVESGFFAVYRCEVKVASFKSLALLHKWWEVTRAVEQSRQARKEATAREAC